MTTSYRRPAVCFALLLAPIAAAHLAARPVPAQGTVIVTVLDKDGAPIRGLRAGDFKIQEDGKSREVLRAEPAIDPLVACVLIDTTKPILGVQAPLQDLRKGLTAFVDTLLQASPGAQVAMIEFGGAAVPTQPMTADPALLARAVARVATSERASGVMLEAFVDASRILAAQATPRRATVSINFATPEGSTMSSRTVSDRVRKSGATVWAVSIQGGSDLNAYQIGPKALDNTLAPAREDVLRVTTEATGGRRLTAVSPAALESLMKRVAESLSAQYEVTFARPDGESPAAIRASATGAAKVLVLPWIR